LILLCESTYEILNGVIPAEKVEMDLFRSVAESVQDSKTSSKQGDHHEWEARRDGKRTMRISE
jgi:hypothetical protein